MPRVISNAAKTLMFQDFLVNLSVEEGGNATTDYAIALAAQFQATLMGVVLRVRPSIVLPSIGFLPNEAMQTVGEKLNESAVAAADHFLEEAKRQGVVADCEMPALPFVEASQRLVQLARCRDLAIVGQPRPQSIQGENLLVEAVLFHAGRPVLVVPYIQVEGPKLDHITVCWDGSRAAVRAIADALPLLKRAQRVDLLTISETWTPNTVFAAGGMAAHLARHHIRVEVVEMPRGDVDVGNVLLNFATDSGTDLMVMGGYGHAKFGEAMFGGATRTLMQSMTVPTLMSH
jgi:nucleotide-binding universal stress UspA family protein